MYVYTYIHVYTYTYVHVSIYIYKFPFTIIYLCVTKSVFLHQRKKESFERDEVWCRVTLCCIFVECVDPICRAHVERFGACCSVFHICCGVYSICRAHVERVDVCCIFVAEYGHAHATFHERVDVCLSVLYMCCSPMQYLLRCKNTRTLRLAGGCCSGLSHLVKICMLQSVLQLLCVTHSIHSLAGFGIVLHMCRSAMQHLLQRLNTHTQRLARCCSGPLPVVKMCVLQSMLQLHACVKQSHTPSHVNVL